VKAFRYAGILGLGFAACGHTSSQTPAGANPGGNAGQNAGSPAVADGGEIPTTTTGGSPAIGGSATAGAPSAAGNGGTSATASDGGAAGAVETPLKHQSCATLAKDCGRGQDNCCASISMPGGNYVNYDDLTLEVGGFELDRFEVTVGRFRAFLATQPAQAVEAFEKEVTAPFWGTWTASPGTNETKPLNQATWATAQYFCEWDGGRLPTRREWEYAARGGDESRPYPWGAEPPDRTRANCSDGCFDQTQPNCAGAERVFPVGSLSPQGDARWGHADMLGNLWEWLEDLRPDIPTSQQHQVRGSSFQYDCRDGINDTFADDPPGTSSHAVGFRCAYDVQ
jgi:hypothetical protein